MIDPFDEAIRATERRIAATREKFGIALPIVDWAAPQPREHLQCDEDELCKWVVEQHPELDAYEFIIENAEPGVATVLFAGHTREFECCFREHRLEIQMEEDWVWYTERVYFTTVRSEKVREEVANDPIERRVPRWFTR